MNIVQTPTFAKQVKKLHNNQKHVLEGAIQEIYANPGIGEMKKGDLQGILVYKFKMFNQLTLLAYQWHQKELILVLIAVGPHENFYRDLK